ncbi:MAG: GYD domain-containing protein [Terracidiphilus sp.]
MPSYLVQTSYTTEALTSLIRNPQNRSDVVRKAVEKLGGSLTGLWLSFGDHDVVCIVEMPNNVSAAALSLAVASGGSVRNTKTTPLLSVEEGQAAIKKAGSSGYKPVGAPK